MSKHMPLYGISQLLAKKSKELRKNHCYSMWFYDKDLNVINICTNQPGWWIGYHGKDVDDLKNTINGMIDEHNNVLIKSFESGKLSFEPELCNKIESINFIECSC